MNRLDNRDTVQKVPNRLDNRDTVQKVSNEVRRPK